ncbi:non-oxidative hydroxyarylic acid decarboxylases subunit D [Bradyrhizobium sp. CCGB20]|uniref:non-oxidative hydroxyarylic acid decarboxylases subunit D n=1 Tax=Bradyrhizobium sp. CCGB20 TaxID=2949633 RepID=UPI0035C68814
MTVTSVRVAPTACPRCRSATLGVVGKSSVAGVWTIFSCSTCFYAWRSTEPEENVDPEKYPAAFRLRPEDLARLKVVPPVPRRRPSS